MGSGLVGFPLVLPPVCGDCPWVVPSVGAWVVRWMLWGGGRCTVDFAWRGSDRLLRVTDWFYFFFRPTVGLRFYGTERLGFSLERLGFSFLDGRDGKW